MTLAATSNELDVQNEWEENPHTKIGGDFLVCYFFSSLSLLLFVFFGCSDGMEREACVCDHGFERSDLCAEIIIIIITHYCITFACTIYKLL